MSKSLTAINIIFAIADTIICLSAIICFSSCAIHFGNWWIVLFSLAPLALFNGHGIIVDADIEEARESRAKQEAEDGTPR